MSEFKFQTFDLSPSPSSAGAYPQQLDEDVLRAGTWVRFLLGSGAGRCGRIVHVGSRRAGWIRYDVEFNPYDDGEIIVVGVSRYIIQPVSLLEVIASAAAG